MAQTEMDYMNNGSIPSGVDSIGDLTTTQYQTKTITSSDNYKFIAVWTNDDRVVSSRLNIRLTINNVEVTDFSVGDTGSSNGLILIPQLVKTGDILSVTPQGGGTTLIYVYGFK